VVIRLIRDIQRENQARGKPTFSVEFFPPKTPEGEIRLLDSVVPQFCQGPVDYCSITYGAGGSTRDTTLSLAGKIQAVHDLTVLMHLTCVQATREEVASVVSEAYRRGVRNILALRGDPPGGTGEFVKTPGGFEYSSELVDFLRQQDRFSIGTAGFPEGHVAQKAGREVDWDHLARKIGNGADFVVTQLFFDNADYFAMRDYLARRHSIEIPIVPGILPVVSASQTRRFVSLCGARLPQPFLEGLEGCGEDDSAVTRFGVDYAARQIEELLREGAPGIHFYTLNKVHSTREVLGQLGYWPSP
jgi:methylenetetrahydrofolate reductase (NADPH)